MCVSYETARDIIGKYAFVKEIFKIEMGFKLK